MKKKTVRKTVSAKKVVTKSLKKKKFSLKSWLFGGLALIAVVLVGSYLSQPKTFKVIELAGKLEDYISPAPIDINLVNAGKTFIKSDDPTVNAQIAATQAKKQNPDITDAQLKAVARRAAEETYQEAEAVGMNIAPKDDQNKTKLKAEVEEAAETAKSFVQNNITIEKNENGENIVVYTPSTSNQVDEKSSCETKNGANVLGGSTVIGAGNVVYKCTSGGWVAQKKTDGTFQTCTAQEIIDNKCPYNITVKPTYLLNQGNNKGEKNCYVGSTIVGQNQVVDGTDGGKRQCDGGELKEVVSYNGEYMSQAEADAKREADKNARTAENKRNCEAINPDTNKPYGKWENNICTQGETAKQASEYQKEFESCKNKTGYEYNNSTHKCEPSKAINQQNIPANNTSYSDTLRSQAAALVVNPNGRLTGGEETTTETDCRYGSELVRAGSNGALYKCKDYAGVVPRTYNQDATRNFGETNTTPQTQVIINETSGASLAECKELQKQYKGGDCLEQGIKDGKYVVNFVPPINSVSTDNDSYAQSSTQGRKVNSATDCNSSEQPQLRRGAPEDGGGMYCVSKPPEKGSISAGSSCDLGGDNACSSGDCRNIENTDGKRGWYCMSEQSYVNRTWADSWVKYSIIGTPVAYAVQFARGIFWINDNTLPNGAYCFGQANACSSGYCANNLSFDTCEVNPFNTSTQSQPTTTTVNKDFSDVENISNAGSDCWSTTTSGTSDKPRCRDICPDFNGDGVGESSEKPGSGGLRTCNSVPVN